MSIRNLAKAAKVSASTITRIETGKQQAQVRTLVKLAQVLKVDIGELLDLADTTAPQRGRAGQAAKANKRKELPVTSEK